MKRLPFHRTALLAAAALLATGGVPPNGNWNTAVAVTPQAHVIGNPDAPVTLTEFISYTCPHCAEFVTEGEAPLQYVYIGSGKLKLEVRPYIRNDVDVAVTMMAQCGPSDRFLRNHTYFLNSQATWLPIAQRATPAQTARWQGDSGAARRNIASDLGFYDMMEARGYSRPEVDHCLNDDKRAAELRANTDADSEKYGVNSTPSFAINGETVKDVHTWSLLRPALDAKIEP